MMLTAVQPITPPTSTPGPSTSDVVVQAIGLNKSFGGTRILRDVSFELRRGQVVLLRGDNGAGKTTLLNILTGTLEPDAGALLIQPDHRVERFRFPRSPLESAKPNDRFSPEGVARAGMVRTWQDVRLFPTLDLRSNVAVAGSGQPGESPFNVLFRPGLVAREERALMSSAERLLDTFGLGGLNGALGDAASLGQRKRVSIARAVQAGAKLLLLDEPLSGLDADGVDQMLRLLVELLEQYELTVVIVEHIFHIPRLMELATDVWTLKDSALQIDSVDSARPHLDSPGLSGWLRSLAGATRSISTTAIESGGILTVVSPAKGSLGDVVLEIRSLKVHRDGKEVLGLASGFSLLLRAGDLAVLEAPNGWGKSSLTDAIAGVLSATSGQIRICGRSLATLPPWKRARLGLAVVRSEQQSFGNLTVNEALEACNAGPPVGLLATLRTRLVSTLSGGERQRLSIASARIEHSRLAIVDEPFDMLDQSAIQRLIRFLGPTPERAVLLMIPSNPDSNLRKGAKE